ncbi:hypothetical protein Tco_0489207 [Tanacetum coccineum]
MVTDPPPTNSTVMPAPRKKLDSEFNDEENKLEMADLLKLKSSSVKASGRSLQQRKEDLFDEYENAFVPLETSPFLTTFSTYCSVPNDALCMATIIRLANLLKLVSQKQFQQQTTSSGLFHLITHARGEGHVARQCKEPKRKMDSQYFKDKALLMEAKEKGDVLDAEAEAFLADSQEMHQDEHLDSDAETEIDDNTIVHQYFLTLSTKLFNENANKVARDILQRFNMPTETIPMLFKKPKMATADLHKDLLGTRNPGLGYMAKRAQPALGTVRLKQAYWLPANERASQTSNTDSPVTPFVHKSRPPSQVLASLQKVNAAFHQFEDIIKERTTQKPDYVSEWCYDYTKQFVEQQLVPFYDHFKKHIQAANETFFKEVREFEQIFDELEAEYEQCVLANKNLTIEKKNLLIKNDCLIAECLEKDICSIVLTSDIVVPPSSNCLCEDLRSACDREHTKVLELEAEISKQKQLITESEKRFAFLEQNYVNLQLKFQNYKQCIDTSSASNAIFEINKLRQQLQGKDDTIRNLDAQINIMKVLNVGSTASSCDQQVQLKDTITSLRIQLDGLKVENVSLKRRYDELSQANTHSRTAYTEKLSALTAGNNQLKAQVTGKTSSGPSTSESPKLLAS